MRRLTKQLLICIVQPLRRLYWRVFRPQTKGVRAIVIDGEGHVLLVKHSYEDNWFLPGGKVGKNEELDDALSRELAAEVGLRKISPSHFGVYENTYEFKRDTIHVYVVNKFEIIANRHFEIEAANFFPKEALPPKISPGTRRRLEEYFGTKKKTANW